MKKTLYTFWASAAVFIIGLMLPAVTFAAATVNTVTLNGGSYVAVNPGDNIVAAVTTTLTNGTKWKGIAWGINTNGTTPLCTNTKNAKDGTRNNDTGVFTETFIIKAPAQPGLYNTYFVADEANNCGKPLAGTTALQYSVRVGSNNVPPTIDPHSDVTVQLLTNASGSVATYTKPLARDAFNNPLAVTCTPTSGSFFVVGNTLVGCTAQDVWGNNASPSYFTVSVLLPIPPPPPADTTPPVIAPHANMSVLSPDGNPVVVTYTLPIATDNVDGTDAVSCLPASGSAFVIGTTTVTCNAHDAAGNNAVSTNFAVGVSVAAPTGPTLVTLASQPDESFFCTPYWDSPNWTDCTTGGSDDATINLGSGANLQGGSLQSVTIVKDENSPVVAQPWFIHLICFTDSGYTQHCTDWVAGNSQYVVGAYDINEPTASSTDQKHWTASFTDATRAHNFNGTSPITFNPSYYYQLYIDDNGFGIGAYGSQSLSQIAWTITGLH